MDKSINKLFDTNDSIDFGQMKDEPFKWLYLLALPYLVWAIEETEICFMNLSLFYQFGKPFKLDEKQLTSDQKDSIYKTVAKFGKNNFSGSSESYILTIDIYTKLLERKILSRNDFKKYEFEFSKNTIDLNNRKLDTSRMTYNNVNILRNQYLRKLLEI